MVNFLCSIWPWLLSGLLGWLLCGLMARSFLRGRDLSGTAAIKEAEANRLSQELTALRARPPVEKIVEKMVDRPVEKVVEKIVDRPVEKIVERIVDRPVEKIVEKIVDRPVDRIVEKIVEKPVDRIVEKMVDNPNHLTRIAALTAEVAIIAGLRNRIQQLESAPPKIVEKIVEKPVEKIVEKIVDRPVEKIIEKIVDRPVDRIVEKIVEKPVDRVVEKTVEKLVDNPSHLARIAALTAEVAVIAGLRGRINQLESQPPKVVEKIVDRPVDRIVEKIVEKPVDRVVEKVVEKMVDNPSHLARIAALTAEVAVIAGLRSRIQQMESAPPKVVEKIVEKIVDRPVEKIVEKIVDRPVDRIVEKIVDRPVEKIVEKIVDRPVEKIVEKIVDRPVDRIVEKIVEKPVDRVVEKLVPDTRGLEERDRQISDWRTRHSDVERKLQERDAELRRLKDDPAIDIDAARRVGVVVKGADDLEIIEGIGPKIAELLRGAGIKTFAELARTPTTRIQTILDNGGSQFRVSNPGTWAEQADLVARNRWTTFKSLTDVLVAGVRVDVAANKAAQQQEQDRETAALARRVSELEAQLAARDAALKNLSDGSPTDVKAARAAGLTIKGADDLEVIEGIGPKIAGLFHKAGVRRFAELARMKPAEIQVILDAAGANYRLADPSTWPDQADLAARNKWEALKALQDSLNAGKRT